MFSGCTALTTAPELPATVTADACYDEMFNGCTSLVNPPELPATIMSNYCYTGMFHDCTALTTAPELPATELTDSCYRAMFRGCSYINYIKMLCISTPAASALDSWLSGASPTGIFVKHINASWNMSGDHGVPNGWTVIFFDPATDRYWTD